jgi:hypothetical protein
MLLFDNYTQLNKMLDLYPLPEEGGFEPLDPHQLLRRLHHLPVHLGCQDPQHLCPKSVHKIIELTCKIAIREPLLNTVRYQKSD